METDDPQGRIYFVESMHRGYRRLRLIRADLGEQSLRISAAISQIKRQKAARTEVLAAVVSGIEMFPLDGGVGERACLYVSRRTRPQFKDFQSSIHRHRGTGRRTLRSPRAAAPGAGSC